MVTIGPLNKTSPYVQFWMDAVVVAPFVAENRSVIRLTVRAVNTGSSSSTFLGAGAHFGSIDGVGEVVRYSADPFLPGVASGADRWTKAADLSVGHDGNGNLGPLTVRMSVQYGSVNESHTATLHVASLPRTPDWIAVDRVSDTQQTVRWGGVGAPASVIVQRQTDDGPWQQIGVVAAGSFTDTTTVGNRKYTYRVARTTGAGQSGWTGTATVFTTPAAPIGVSAERAGTDIKVSVSTVPRWATSFDARDGATIVGTSVSLPWTHAAPSPSVPHAYQVRGKVGALLGAWSAVSNTVQLISPPNAPTGLTPNGAVRAAGEPVTFRWTHNPVDSSAQTAYELRIRLPAGSWVTFSGTTAESSRALPLAAATREWQVRTKGSHPDFSPWSATAVVDVIDRPGVAVLQPDTEWDASTLTVEWSWLQAQGRPQSAWQVELIGPAGEGGVRSGSGADSSVTLSTRLTEGSWTVRVRAATGDVWSVWASATFDVVFDPPATPTITGAWDESQGGVNLTVMPGEGIGVPETVRIVIERSAADGWELVAETTGVTTLIDWESPSFGDIRYRATAFTLEGAAAVEMIVVEATSGAVWISGGVGFSITARLPLDPVIQITASRERTPKQYAGRALPVVLIGEALARAVAISGETSDLESDTASSALLTRLAQIDSALFLFRDPDGNRIYGGIGPISMGRKSSEWHPEGWNSIWGYSLTLTEATA